MTDEGSKERKNVKGTNTPRVTIRDVAKDADVSFAAVSKVLRNAYGVSDALRAKVNASIEKLGYRPNTAARGMRGGRTFVIGTIFPDFRNPFFSEIFAGVSSALERTQYQSFLGFVRYSSEPAIIRSMLDIQMDGVIVVGSVRPYEELANLAREIPLVTIGHHLPQAKDFDVLNNDDYRSGIAVVEHLTNNGYRNIVMLSLDIENGSVIVAREEGYKAKMAELGLSQFTRVVRTSQMLRDIQTETKQLLESGNPPDAIFCWTDFVALEVLSVAKQLGISVPEDLAIVGHDNTFYCDFRQNNLTSVDQQGEQLGLQAARLLVERIEGRKQAEHFTLPPRLVARGSSAPKHKDES